MRKILSLAALLLCSFSAAAIDDATLMASAHKDDLPVATPVAERAPARPVTGNAVQYGEQDGTPLTGYLAVPEGGGADLPGLIVIHEWWGLNDNIRQVTERLAGEGYRALAVDLYRGEVAEYPAGAMKLSRALGKAKEPAEDNLRQAYAFLESAGAERIGVIGWCLGGRWSLRTALLLPDQVDAVVIYYGRLVTDPKALARLQMPVLGNFGGDDPLIPLTNVEAFEAAMRDLGKEVDLKVYPGAEHAFSNPSGGAYNEAAATDAWARSTTFLARNLKP